MTLNFGIVGTGGIAQGGHGLALQHTSQARLWSVCSRDEQRAVSFSQIHRAHAPRPAFASLDDFLADPELHAVIIATPDGLHVEQALRAAQAGKHILLEKPMSVDLAGANAIIEACDRHHVQLGIAYHLRWHTGHRALIQQAHAGSLGKLRHVRAQWSWKAPDARNWRASEEVGRWWSLAGVGTHCLDMIRWALLPGSGEVVSVSSVVSRSVFGGPHDETAVLALRFENGATAELCSSVLFDAPTRFEIYGSTGFAICEGTFGRQGGGKIWTNTGPIEFQPKNPFVDQIDQFAQSVLSGTAPEVSGREGARNVEILSQAA